MAFEDFIERKWLDAINIAATEPAPGNREEERAGGKARAADKASGGETGAMKLTGAVNTVEREEKPRSPSPHWDLSYRKRCRARNLIGCDGNHLILQCEKLRGMKLAERREVVERSGLCTFCLRHAVELECYAKGGLTKPRCTRPDCDGEHTSKLHTLVGEDDAEVNIVAGDDDEVASGHEGEYDHQLDHEYEDLWVGTFEAADAPEGAAEGRGLPQRDHWVEEEGIADQYGCEYESLWVGTIRAAEEMDRSASTATEREPTREDSLVEVEEEVSGSGQWDLETHQPGGGAARVGGTMCGSPRRPLGGQGRPALPAGAGRVRTKADPKAISDQQWEGARYNAWLRQLLSDDSSNGEEDEERYGRFAESGRWITELYGIPQESAPTLGRECSA